MKLIASLISLLAATLSFAEELTLMSYNIRLDLASDAPNHWDNRREQLAAQIAFTAPDIFGIQEGLPHQVAYLDRTLENYAYLGVGRDDGKSAGEHSAIFYLKDKYEVLDSGTFWLSETPEIPSFGWGASYRRICTYAHFKNKLTKNTYWVFNTHLDHKVAEARLKGVQLILLRIADLVIGNDPYFLMGDLNATPESPPIQLISLSMQDARTHSLRQPFGREGTMNDFDAHTTATRRIDFIFASPNVAINQYAALSDLIDQRYPSDHFPVVVRAIIPPYLPYRLKVSKNQRHLVDESDRPFFWTADTAWELFHRLSLDEAKHYLDLRAAQGFNLVQAVILAEQNGLTHPNANGDLPLHDLDPTQPNEAYFQHVDAVIEAANARGIVIGLLPTWGDKFNKKWGVGPEIFTPQNAETYARFLSKRYAEASIVWILGGDRIPEEEDDYEITRAMARGIRSEAGGEHLITYHPSGMSSSSQFFHEEQWLDFNMFQSSHAIEHNPNYTFILKDRSLAPAKPTLDGEPCYEYIHIDFKTENPRFTDFHSRRAGYWSVLAGALGHTYGHNSVWQMWSEPHHPVLSADVPWHEAIHYPGSYQTGYMRQAFESVAWHTLEPAQELLLEQSDSQSSHIRVAADGSRQLVLAYIPHGQSFSLDATQLSEINSSQWFNPRTGNRFSFQANENAPFDPPGDEAPANDWLLVLSRKQLPLEKSSESVTNGN